jgi:transcriptional regulator with XRE-family HTH domain
MALDPLVLKHARRVRGWTQAKAADRLGVSQGYVSLLESGKRTVPNRLLPALRRKVGLPLSALPPRDKLTLKPSHLPEALAALGYEPLAYLRGRPALNPAEVLLTALSQEDLPSRLVEALPWLVLRYTDLNWGWLIERAKVHDVQNRLGYLVTLAREVVEGRDTSLATQLDGLARRLERSKLAREDTLCHDSMTEAERRWLREERSAAARRWNLLTDLSPAHLSYAS